jgi:hypothetical protein
MLRLEQPKFETASDYYDFLLACVFSVVMVGLPIFSYIILKKKQANLDDEKFKQKFGSFYDGFASHNKSSRKNCTLVTSFFLLRRLLLAAVLVPLRYQTVWLQVASNIWLCLVDSCIKQHLNPYESKISGLMQKMNDVVVLLLSIFILLFTDLTKS